MAELQVTIPYKTSQARIVFSIMCILSPLWAIIAPAGLGLLIGLIISSPGSMPFLTLVMWSLLLTLTTVGGILLTGFSEGNCIHLSKNGISFPPFFLPKLQFRRARSWSELINADVHVVENAKGNEQRVLVLGFDSGISLVLRLACCSQPEIEKFLLAIELWAARCKRSPALIDYQTQIQNREQGVTGIGYTQMWEEELSRRFQATSFVPLEPGKKLKEGKLVILRQLAFGGLSAIYLAQQDKLDMVVLKEAVVPQNADPKMREQAEQQLNREAKLLATLQHPNIARVLDHFTEDGRHYLMLEYINGQDLRQYVKQNGTVNQKMAMEWGLKILGILHALHTQQPPILHRDLTPENLVLTKESIVLIDFGAANQFVGKATGTVVGKQAYIPAEQLRGKSVIESDIYAFGGTLYFLLTGKDPVPLSAVHPQSIVPEIDIELDEVVATCCAFEAEDRYHGAMEAAEALRKILSHAKGEEALGIVIQRS